MPPPTMLSVAQLTRLIGLPEAPALVDLRTEAEFAADPRLLPGARRRDAAFVAGWAAAYTGADSVVVVCQDGRAASQGAAAWLRHAGVAAESLEGGFDAWASSGAPLVNISALPPAGPGGGTIWVTRARPKVDRIACPWLIRRFVDPDAVFLFVAPPEVPAVAERFGAAPFDIEEVFWSHRGALCTFDVMLAEFGLHTPALDRLALVVRAADTARLDLAPQAAGLLAASLGLSRMFKDDVAQLEAGLSLYDAFYRWARDAAAETHDWPSLQTDERAAKVRVP